MHTLTECKCLSAVKPSIAFTHEAGKPHAPSMSLCYTIRENIYEMKHSGVQRGIPREDQCCSCFTLPATTTFSGVTTMTSPKTVLCISSYEKGQEFIRECKRQE